VLDPGGPGFKFADLDPEVGNIVAGPVGFGHDELPRVYRRVKLSENDPYGREKEDITLFA
jgi:hypothetical protein